MNNHTKDLWFNTACKTIGLVAVFSFLCLGVFGQEAKQGDKAAAAAPGILPEWTGEARVGNPYDELSKSGKHVVPVVYSRLDEKADEKYKKIMGGSVYFAVFKNMGALAKDGDTFGTGMKDFDKKFNGGDGFQFSPGFDTSANYLYLYQVVNARCLDGRNFLEDPIAQKDRLTEKDVIKDFKRVSPPTEAIARWALTLAVRPRDISSWGYFNGASFVAHETASLNLFAEETKLPTTIKPISFLPSMLRETPNPIYKNRAPAQALGALQPSFHVGSSTANLDKSPAYPGNDNAIKFAVSADAQEKIKLPVFKEGERPLSALLNAAFDEKTKKFRFDVNPSSVQIMYDAQSDLLRGEWAAYNDQEIIRSVLLVKFDDDQGLKNGQFSVVFGFTSNLPPRPERVRLDTAESVRESRRYENRPADLFARQQVDDAESISSMVLLAAAGKKDTVPALKAFSREPALWAPVGGFGGIGIGSVGVPAKEIVNRDSQRTTGQVFVADGLDDSVNLTLQPGPGVPAPGVPAPGIINVAANDPREIPGPTPAPAAGGAAITGGFSTGLGGVSTGGGGGGFGFPGLAGVGGSGVGGGFGGAGGGIGGSSGQQQQQPPTNQGTVIDINNSLTNQQKQQQQQQQKQQQQQFQHQHQGQHQGNHNHNHGHNHGPVVPAPASLLLGLLGLPALLLLRRRKTEPASETIA